MVSALHNKDFYPGALSVNKKDRNSSTYEITNVKDFDSFDLSEMKSTFAKNGIHVYEVNTEGNICNGNRTGKISLKVRENEEDDQKVKIVSEKLKEKGYDLKQKVKISNSKMMYIIYIYY